MEKIKLVIEENRFINTQTPFGEKSQDYMCENTFIFDRGKIYGIVCEHGGGGEAVSLLLSGIMPLKQEKIYIDNKEADAEEMKRIGWYVGKALYSSGIVKRELSVRKALEFAVRKYHRYEEISEVMEEFHLTADRLDYGLSRNCEWEKRRASLAIGYANNKIVYCFPWMNSMIFYDRMYNSSVFRFFRKLTQEGAVIILPTSRKENVSGFADSLIEIYNTRFEHIISESPYFIENF